MTDAKNIRRFLTNLFAFPNDYFSEHSSDELGISEEERQELIKLQIATPMDERTTPRERIAEFEKELFEDAE